MVSSTTVRLLLAAALAPLAAHAQEVACYAPDGHTLGDNETYVPCNKLGITQNGIYSSCCNLDGKTDERDLCTSTGLCLNNGVLKRAYCTDKNWNSDACVKVCTDDKNNGNSNGTIEITPCTGGNTYCCGKNNLSCCGTKDAFVLPELVNKAASSTQSAAVVTETATVESATFKNATIGLAVVLGVVIVAALAGMFFLHRKNKALYQQLSQVPPPMEQNKDTPPANDHVNAYVQSYNPGSTVGAGSSTSPYLDYSQQYKTGAASIVPPSSPGPSEAPTHARYSELDATVVASKNDLASPVPSYNPGTVPEEQQFSVIQPPHSPGYEQSLASPPLPPQQNQGHNH